MTPQERAALENEIFNSHALAAQANRKMAEATQQLVLRAGRNGGGGESGVSEEVAEFLRKIVDGLERFAAVVEEGAVLLKEELTEGGGKRVPVADALAPPKSKRSDNGRATTKADRDDMKAQRKALAVPFALALIDSLGPVSNRYIVDMMIRTTQFRKKMDKVKLKPSPAGVSQVLFAEPNLLTFDSKAKVWMRAGKAGAEAEAKKEDAG